MRRRLVRRYGGVRLVKGFKILFAVSWSAQLMAAEVPPRVSFEKQIQPLLQATCLKCHDADTAKGDVDLSEFKTEADFARDPRQLEKIVRLVRDREMPPPGKRPQPKEQDRQLLIDWGTHTLAHIDYDKFPKDPGRVVIHRLSRTEYNNTVRDLLGVTSNPAERFPADGGGGGGFDNNADTLFVPPLLMEKYLEVAGDMLAEVPAERLAPHRPGWIVTQHAAARRNIEAFARRAFRRPADAAEVAALMKLYESARERGSFEDAVRFTLKAVLVSPHFIFRIERDQISTEPYRISSYELASRLSYFLWSSMPDDELFRVAATGRLHEPTVLESQVKRMLKDPKSRVFSDNFAGQWLRVRELKTTVQPDPGRFEKFTPELRDAMYREVVEFFDDVLRSDRSLMTLLDANHTFVNAALAEHYGITNVAGGELRRVELTDRNRGGVLGMGAVLTLTSYPQRTSPVLRGKWILEELLGAPPPPPPPDAGGLPAADAPRNGLTFRQRLEQHRNKPQCSGCHSRMDPLGFGLENFDAIGRWRTEIGQVPVDASGEMTTGEKFSGPAELKQLLLQRKDEFARNLSERMLAYALGRGVEFYDMPTIQKITQRLKEENYRSSTLILEIVKSYPFQFRRNQGQETKR